MPTSFQNSALYGQLFGDGELEAMLSERQDIARMIQFETALARVQARIGLVPEESAEAIEKSLASVEMDPAELSDATRNDGVPVPGLVSALRKQIADDHAGWIHWGATSQDVLDTAQMLGTRKALDLISERLGRLIDVLTAKARDHSAVLMAGRTRGQIATPITFGLRVAQWTQPLITLESTLSDLRTRCLRVQFGGATGANTAVYPHGADIASGLAAELGLSDGPPWHTDRGPVTEMAGWLLRLSQAMAKFADDLILMSRSEIAEVRAGTGGGSSTMPQKSNPVGPETICALATLANGAHAALLQAAVHREERDGSRWPVEWVLLPQLLLAAGAGLRHAVLLAETLEPVEENMQATLMSHPAVMAEQASFALAQHMPRAEAQALVKTALAADKPFSQALTELAPVNLDWDAELSTDKTVSSCNDLIEQILSRRG